MKQTTSNAPLNFRCVLASILSSSFYTFIDKLLIRLSSNLADGLIMGLPPELISFWSHSAEFLPLTGGGGGVGGWVGGWGWGVGGWVGWWWWGGGGWWWWWWGGGLGGVVVVVGGLSYIQCSFISHWLGAYAKWSWKCRFIAYGEAILIYMVWWFCISSVPPVTFYTYHALLSVPFCILTLESFTIMFIFNWCIPHMFLVINIMIMKENVIIYFWHDFWLGALFHYNCLSRYGDFHYDHKRVLSL